MANYYTHFCCELDVGSAENAQRALEIFNEGRAIDDASDEDNEYSFEVSVDPTADSKLVIQDNDCSDINDVAEYVTACGKAFGLKGLWGFQYAHTCSRPRTDAYGGGAVLINLETGTATGFDSGNWLNEQLAAGAAHG